MTDRELAGCALLPCPFCGREAKRDDRTEYQSYSASESQSMGMGVSAGGFSSTTYAIQCGCGIRVQGNNDAFLIERWNRRTPNSEGDGRDGERLERRALLWLAGGDSGMSSKAICHHMLGMKCDRSYPLDPSDLGRCLRMLELFPEWKARIGEMASYSPQWAGLAARWDELAAMMADEVGIDWSKGRKASRTYAAIDAVIAAAEGGE